MAEIIYFRSDTLGPFPALTTDDGKIDFGALGEKFKLEPKSITLCHFTVPRTKDDETKSEWKNLKEIFGVAGTAADPVMVGGDKAPVHAVSTEEIPPMPLTFAEFLSPKFIHLLGVLPLGDYDISRCMEDEFFLPGNFKSVPLEVGVMETWLLEFFSSNVVLSVIGRFCEMEKSCLGQEYFVRGGLSMFALRIWRDIEDEVFATWNEVKVCPTWNEQLDIERDTGRTMVTRQMAMEVRASGSVGGRGSRRGEGGGGGSRGDKGGGVSGSSGGGGGGRDRGVSGSSGRGGGGQGRGVSGSSGGGGGGRGRGVSGNSGGGGGGRGRGVSGSSGGGGGGRGRGGRGRGRGRGRAFAHVESHYIPLPMFISPNKNTSSSCVVRQSIRSRSLMFETHVAPRHLLASQLYDPFSSEVGDFTLYHGMRDSSWLSFCEKGIAPPQGRNEFSSFGAFYLTNSLRQAFEHPLHQHPRKDVEDHISVLVFTVPIAILHGDESPSGSLPFHVKWFNNVDEDEEWRSFCVKNLRTPEYPNHNYDIVIGPSCLPSSPQHVTWLQIDGYTPTQVAFCTARAWDWITTKASKILREQRLEDFSPAVALVAKQSPAFSAEKPKAVVSKAKDVARVDIGTVLTSILDYAVAAAVTGVDSLTLEEEKKLAVTDTIDAAIRHRLAPDLESLLMMFKNTMYAEGFKSAIESQRRSARQ